MNISCVEELMVVFPQSSFEFSFCFSPPISDYDVFNEGKTLSFLESQQGVMTLCTYLEDIKKKRERLSKKELFEYFRKLLQVSVQAQHKPLSVLLLSMRACKTVK